MESRPMSPKRFAVIILCTGLALCSLFSCIARYYDAKWRVTPPQPDTLIYQQYARAIAEGHPYRFMASDEPTTGSTSHLYPALLAILYWAGAKDEALPTAGFFLNAFFYLLFLLLYLDVTRRMAPDSLFLAGWLCVLSGQTIFSALGQSDIGIFMVLSLGAFDMALRERPGACGALLFLASWCRPEGAILSIMMVVVSLLPMNEKQQRSRPLFLAGMAGLAGLGGVLLLNYSLTGTTAFTSVLGKSPLLALTLPTLVFRTCDSLGGMLMGIAFGVTSGGRQLYLLPIIGGILALIGLASRDWKAGRTSRVEIWWWGSSLLAVAVVAISGWQGIAHDRYFAWILPIWLLYCTIGLRALCTRFSQPLLYRTLGAMLLIYQIVGMFFFASAYAGICAGTQSTIQFARKTNARLEKGCRVAVNGFAGIAYYMPDLHILNINGITTRELTVPYPVAYNLETLKHRPALRSEKWFISVADKSGGFFSDLVGKQIDVACPALKAGASPGLFSAEWDLLDYPLAPNAHDATESVRGMRMVDSLDIGFMNDEIRCDYEIYSRIKGAKIGPCIKKGTIHGREILDVGRVIYGYEKFRIRCEPNRPLRIILRMSLKATAETDTPPRGTQQQDFEFVPPLRLIAFVDDQGLDMMSFSLGADSSDFHEVIFDIPASYIKNDTPEITIGGDHISFAYWFYQ